MDAGSQLVRAWVLTPASDFWIFSLALAMSRRIVLAPFSCKQRRKNQEFLFKKKILKHGEKKIQQGSSKKKKNQKTTQQKEGRAGGIGNFPFHDSAIFAARIGAKSGGTDCNPCHVS